jgi:hypothetical protein
VEFGSIATLNPGSPPSEPVLLSVSAHCLLEAVRVDYMVELQHALKGVAQYKDNKPGKFYITGELT